MNLKLSNGTQINLNELDKLEHKSSDNDLLKFFDSLLLGGNKNNIFDKNEIEKIKAFLTEMAGEDGVIDGTDIKNTRLKYASIFENYNEQDFADDLFLLSSSTSAKVAAGPKYKVRKGDTPQKIVESLGYTGKDAEKYKAALIAQLDENSSFMNDRNWLMAGSTINLLSDEMLKELGLAKPKKQPLKSSESENEHRIRPEDRSTSSSPDYRVKSGDTIPKIVASLGYTGKAAEKYQSALEAQLEADGSFMNEKKWLMAGSTIKLLSDEKLKKLGITKTAKQPERVPANSEHKEDNVVNTEGQQFSTQERPVNFDDSGHVVTNSVERIKSVIESSGHKTMMVNPKVLTGNPGKLYRDYKSLYGVEPQIIKDTSTGELHIFVNTSKSTRGKKQGLSSIEIVCDGKDQDYNKINRFYTNGKIVQDIIYPGTDGKNDYSVMVQRPLNQKGIKRRVISEALPLRITYPKSLLADATPEQKKEIMDFMNTLVTKKASLMKDLKMDNDTYDRFAHLALGIAMQETQFGKAKSYKNWENTGVVTFAKDSIATINRGLKKIGAKNPINNSTAVSKGLTQVKVADWAKNGRVSALFKKYGIETGFCDSLDGGQSAVATMIVLSELQKRVRGQSYQDGIEMANNNYYYSNAKLANGETVRRPAGYMLYNNVSEDDAILYLYNGRSGTLRKGTATPGILLYSHNVDRYKQMFKLSTSNPKRREAALRRAKTVVENLPAGRKSTKDDLGWGIGQVIFMPKLYTADAPLNSASEINKLKETLLLKGFNPKSVNVLINRMKRGEISFANGLTDEERMSMTEQDLTRLISHGNLLNKNLKGVNNVEQQRLIASSADRNFKRCYLVSHARQYNINGRENQSVILNDLRNVNIEKYPSNGYNTGAEQRCNRYLTQLRAGRNPDGGLYAYAQRRENGRYMGFDVERFSGLNLNNASSVDLLFARNCADSAATLRTSGGCLTGIKQALIGSGAVSEAEMRNFNNAFQLAKFLEKHPNRFQEIKYVQLSDNVVREFTASDVEHLPAGYIVVYGNRSRTDVPGHAGGSTGNGQIAADEFDNGNWDNFASKSANQNGKGEHGYVRVFRLNPEYYTVQNGRLVPKS